jgi:Flp pilus assembly protein TadB
MLRVLIAMTDGADPVHAVESAARTMRASASIAADSQAAVAQTLASIRILTWVPIALAVLLAVRDESVREFFLSAAGLICIAAGVALNGLGRHVTARLTARAVRVRSDIPDFIDMTSVHLRAGKPPALAFMHSAEGAGGITGSTARRVVDKVRAGDRFVDALLMHRELFDLRAQPLIDALVDTERDGLPPRELFDRLSDEAKSQRRREADRRLRALPVQLALPLVGCVLPAYVLLAVFPLLIGQFSSVTLDPL